MQVLLRYALSLALPLFMAVAALADGPLGTFDLASLDGTNGFRLAGTGTDDWNGLSVSSAGDVNGDGFDDVIVGAPVTPVDFGLGRAYVVFGAAGGFPATLSLDSLDGSNGFLLEGAGSPDRAGWSVAGIGDFNADGTDDLIVGAWQSSAGGRTRNGRAYVVFGSAGGFPSSIELTSLDGTDGFALNGVANEDNAGEAVAACGDLNADGIVDLVVAAPKRSQAYVVFGSASPFPAELELSSLDGSDGFRFDGTAAADGCGRSIEGGIDLNDDGIDDVAIGAPFAVGEAGQTYVVFGSDQPFAATMSVASLDGSNGFTVNGITAGDRCGIVGNGGDPNRDGIDDLLLGAPNASAVAGAAYVLYGSDAGFASSVNLSGLDGSNGFTMTAPGAASLGFALTSLGDVDGDSFDDLLIAAPGGAGRAYVLYGRSAGFPALVDLNAMLEGEGFVLEGLVGGDGLGTSVAAAVDLNGDGVRDVMLSAPFARSGRGDTYVLFGIGCLQGTVNLANGAPLDILFVNGRNGGYERSVDIEDDDLLTVTMINPGLGNGRFVLHANEGCPSAFTQAPLPASIGTTCFPFLLSKGATPLIVANSLGKESKVGASHFLGTPWADPETATTEMLFPSLPIGTEMTFQGVILDPGAVSSKGASTTNAVVVRVN